MFQARIHDSYEKMDKKKSVWICKWIGQRHAHEASHDLKKLVFEDLTTYIPEADLQKF